MDTVKNINGKVYFHNLKFDGFFLLHWLLSNGYVFRENTRKLGAGEFTALISKMGLFFNITVQWTVSKRTEFRDSLKKLPYSAAVVADAFKLEVSKGEIDYHKERPIGYRMTPEERNYLARDVLIIAQALKVQFDTGLVKMTVASDAMTEFKALMGQRTFDRMFPQLPGPMDADIRSAYRGGFTYADPRIRGKVTGPGKTYDVNSLYPSVMYDRLLPYGKPEFRRGMPKDVPGYPLFITNITFTAKLKPNHIPCIQVKGSMHHLPTEYQEVIKEPVTMSVSSVDLELWKDHYDLTILSYNGTWYFKGVTGLFKKYIEKWSKIKAESTGGMRALAKLMLNSLYGKFASNPDVTGKVPYLKDGIVNLRIGSPRTTRPVYTAMGVFITAYARDVTIRAAQAHYDVFAYCDTDSLHLLTTEDPEDLDVDPKKLGAWKHEYDFKRGLFIRAKTYIEHLTECSDPDEHVHEAGECYETHVAGLPVDIAESLTIEDFVSGAKFKRRQPQRVPGGVVLIDVDYTLPEW